MKLSENPEIRGTFDREKIISIPCGDEGGRGERRVNLDLICANARRTSSDFSSGRYISLVSHDLIAKVSARRRREESEREREEE